MKPYVKSNRNDAADAEAICEAVARPNMRFVPIKSVEQQAVLSLHRVRQGFVVARTAQANQIRGLLAEFGLVLPTGLCALRKQLPVLLDGVSDQVPEVFWRLVRRLHEHLVELDRQVGELKVQIRQWHRSCVQSQRLEKIPGVGQLTATALVTSIADAHSFKNGRQLAAWLGLVPRQHSSGGKPTLLGIGKRGDVYLRTLLIRGALAALSAAKRHAKSNPWLGKLLERRNPNVAAVALANKNARTVWALLAHDREFLVDYTPNLATAQPASASDNEQDRYFTDCSGNLLVMAKQVGPWLAKPIRGEALRVH